MTPLYFNLDLRSGKMFGAITDYGIVPAFFTDQDKAETFFNEKKAGGILGRCDSLKDFRSTLEFNENCYVILDGEAITLKMFTERFIDRPSKGQDPQL